MLTLLSSPRTLLSLGSVVTGANWSLLSSTLSTFLSSPQSLSTAATTFNWSLLRSEAVVGAAHSVGTRLLESLTARYYSLDPPPPPSPPHLRPPLSALAGSRAALASSFLPPLPGSFPSPPSPPPVKRRVSFHPTVCCKAITDASDPLRWDRAADLSAVCYAVPLRRVRFREEVHVTWVWKYLVPDGRNQVYFPRTRWVGEGVVLGRVDDEGDVLMGGC
ncbi:hypothetical protein G7Y79_00017g042600 [Physcia stellaris]|nr:hypothetical protein G7Y79_00017g042600 [Physcia stellaris]